MAGFFDILNQIGTSPDFARAQDQFMGVDPNIRIQNQQQVAAQQALFDKQKKQEQTNKYLGDALAKTGGQLTPAVLQTIAQVDPDMYVKLLKEYNDQQKATQPDLQFNPQSGEVFDMNVGLPYNAVGQSNMPKGNADMPAGLNPLQQRLWMEQQIRSQFDNQKAMRDEMLKQEAEKRQLDAKIEAEKRSPTESQSNANTFATRMLGAAKVLDDPNFTAIATNPAQAAAGITNITATPEYQQVSRAQLDWLTANLRKESGAAIPESEYKNEAKKFFPQVGDSQKVIADKAAARKAAEQGMIKAAGALGADIKTPKASKVEEPAIDLNKITLEQAKAMTPAQLRKALGK